MSVETVPNIHAFTSFSSSSANNLEVFFMFPQAKNEQRTMERALVLYSSPIVLLMLSFSESWIATYHFVEFTIRTNKVTQYVLFVVIQKQIFHNYKYLLIKHKLKNKESTPSEWRYSLNKLLIIKILVIYAE